MSCGKKEGVGMKSGSTWVNTYICAYVRDKRSGEHTAGGADRTVDNAPS